MAQDAFQDKVALVVRRSTSGYAGPEVAAHIRATLLGWGLGKANPEAPLQDIIANGASVLIKPNWAHHVNGSGDEMSSMVTHPEFILASLQEVLACEPSNHSGVEFEPDERFTRIIMHITKPHRHLTRYRGGTRTSRGTSADEANKPRSAADQAGLRDRPVGMPSMRWRDADHRVHC